MKSGANLYIQHLFSGIALLLALLFVFPSATLAEHEDPQESTVRVALSTGQINKLTVTVEGQYACGDQTFVGGTLTVRAKDGNVRVSHSELGELARGDSVTVVRQEETVWAAFLTLANTRYGSCRYLGDMVFQNDGNDRLVVINRVGMRAYLYGVVGGELRNTHPMEALKAQAVAAKCFALTCMDDAASYDVDDTPTDQVYKGYHPAHENVIAAVNAVADDLLLFMDEVVRCYYCTSNGGQTITPLMRWGNNGDQNAVFQMTYDPYDLEGAENAQLLHILPDAHTLPEALQGYLLCIAKEQNPAVAELVTIRSMEGVHDPSNPDGSFVAPRELASQSQIDLTMDCRTADGTPLTIDCSMPMDAFTEEGILSAPDANTRYLRAEDDGSWTVIFAEAVGHRVGMSHEGLLQRAEAGFTYDEILQFYYPGATLCHGSEAPMQADAIPAPTAVAAEETPAPTATPEPALIPYERDVSLWARIFGKD